MADLCALAWLYLFSRVCQALDSSLESSNGDSASGEQCGSVAKIVKGTNAKFANLPQFLQSYHSPTANLRILEEENNQTELDSSVQVDSKETSACAERYPLFCHADKSARNDGKNAASKKVDSRNEAKNVSKSAQDSRSFDKEAQNVFCSHATRRQDFCDKNGVLQGESKARTWACVTADSPQQSPFLAKKPTPKPNKAESPLDKVAYAT